MRYYLPVTTDSADSADLTMFDEIRTTTRVALADDGLYRLYDGQLYRYKLVKGTRSGIHKDILPGVNVVYDDTTMKPHNKAFRVPLRNQMVDMVVAKYSLPEHPGITLVLERLNGKLTDIYLEKPGGDELLPAVLHSFLLLLSNMLSM